MNGLVFPIYCSLSMPTAIVWFSLAFVCPFVHAISEKHCSLDVVVVVVNHVTSTIEQ